MFKLALEFITPYFLRFVAWGKLFLRRRWRRFQKVFHTPRKLFKWIFIIVVMIKTRATPRNIRKFIRWCVKRSSGFVRTSVLIGLTESFDHPSFILYLKINLFIFFWLKMFQELAYNFKCPLATLIFGELNRNIKRHPKTIAKLAKEEADYLAAIEKKKNPRARYVFKPYVDPFHNKEERKKRIAKAVAEHEAKVELNRIKLMEWRAKRRPAKRERVKLRKLAKQNRRRKKGQKSWWQF